MIGLMLIAVLIIGLTSFFIGLGLRWLTGQVSGQIERRFHDADSIVNHHQIPESWLQPFRLQMQRQPDLRTLATRARTRCLKNMDALIAFYEEGRFVANIETQSLLLGELRQQREHWLMLDWENILKVRMTASIETVE